MAALLLDIHICHLCFPCKFFLNHKINSNYNKLYFEFNRLNAGKFMFVEFTITCFWQDDFVRKSGVMFHVLISNILKFKIDVCWTCVQILPTI